MTKPDAEFSAVSRNYIRNDTEDFTLSDADVSELLSNGKQTIFGNRIG